MAMSTSQIQNLSPPDILTFGDIPHARLLLARARNPTTRMYNNAILRCILSPSKKTPNSNYLHLYADMLAEGRLPDSHTINSLLKTFAGRRALLEGKLIHCHVVKFGFAVDIYTKNSLMRLYSVCGKMALARLLFDRSPHRDLVSWTTLISGYAKSGFSEEAVSLFFQMMDDGDNSRPDPVIMSTVLSVCAKLRDVELGRYLHRCIARYKVDFDVVLGNALVDMYSKCGDSESAGNVFRSMPIKNVVTWNAMISGLVWNGKFREAISMFRRMQQREGIEPDGVTLVGVLNSCANLGALELGEWVHSYVDRAGIEADGIIGNALVDMYAKCGRIDRAKEVFARMARKDVYTFTAMIVGYAMHGRGESALGLFSTMSVEGVKPNGATFVGVLTACSHSGFVELGLGHFQDMSLVYGLKHRIEHYGCVVDMLGRAGLFDAAIQFIERMRIEPDAIVWSSLLGSCRVHGNVELGEKIAEKLLELKPGEDGGYVLMSNIYASADRRGDARSTRRAMKKKKVKKAPGCSAVEVDGAVHEFRMRDKSHPDRAKIYTVAEGIGRVIRTDGCENFSVEILDEPLY